VEKEKWIIPVVIGALRDVSSQFKNFFLPT